MNQFAMGQSYSQQPFNNLRRRFIYSINASTQASIILMANGDQVADHCFIIDQALVHANQEAFLPVKMRDLYNLDPQDTLLGDLDPAYQGLIFPDRSPESMDLESIMGDLVDPDTKERIMNAVNQSLANNMEKVQVLDSNIRSLYSLASRLVNNGA